MSRQLQPQLQTSDHDNGANESALTHVGTSDHSPNIVKMKHAVGANIEPQDMLGVHSKHDRVLGKKLAQDSSVESDDDGFNQHQLSP